ncbi:dpp11 [Symbiodinium necroappetens]|uniref:Dpp11 protein n=1 Tax=Symbiodinium necroappetens TaxID=1628268 RepID=A0A812J826_9DINO|nr:dpp11 [Symbiodinium necroappetens]
MASSPRFRTWPITAVKSLEPMLQKMGLKVSADAIDGTSKSEGSGGRHFSDALVSVGAAGRGGTGSFVSSSGLILTNWHVAYDAVRQASLQGSHDYVRDGFVAKSLKEELKGPNYEVWITKSCKDVSKEVTDVIGSEQDPLKRANRVRDVMQEIAQAAQAEKPSGEASDGGKRCDVQEMLPNESYVLFTYERIKDVRIVYVPPKSLGNFGGDTDNFEWPRHTADFTLLRAYVGPDGKAAEYSVDNVPYKPKTFLKVQQQGAAEGDFIFLLGFPGSTMRYAPTSRLRFSDEVAVPNMVSDFARKLQLIAQYEKDSEEAALKLGTSKKGLANEYKRSQGKLVMMRKLGLMQERSQEEAALCAKAPEAKEALDRLSKIYDELRAMESVSTALEACRGIYCGSALLAVGHALHEYLTIECPKPDGERESSYRQRNLPFLAQRLAKRVGEIHQPHEAALIKDALDMLEKTPDLKSAFAAILKSFGGESYLSKMESTIGSSELKALSDPELMKSIFAEDGAAKDRKALLEDPFVKCAGSLWEAYASNRDRSKALLSERDALFAKLLELQRKHSDGEVMYPDCNGSLRISAGFVEGYEAADAVVCKPQTTLAGLFDKAVEAKLSKDEGRLAEFGCPDRLYDMLSSPSSNCQKVPVCLLYSTDTVGGNSGSPVMNANGELVGINFDRQRQGLMNEFKWSKDYSRSMGVDVRYMLWLMGDYDGAKNLVQEMLEG